jgi:hypothetical protein
MVKPLDGNIGPVLEKRTAENPEIYLFVKYSRIDPINIAYQPPAMPGEQFKDLSDAPSRN